MARKKIPQKDGEEWKPIANTKEYFVSNIGRVRKNLKLLTCSPNTYGYPACWIEIYDKEGNKKRKRASVHRLVAQAFVPNPGNKEVVDHIDGNKVNNRAENLRWVTVQENTQFAYDKDLIAKSERDEVIAIDPYDYVFLYRTQAEAARDTGTDAKTVNQVIKGLIKSAKGWRFFRMKGLEDKR